MASRASTGDVTLVIDTDLEEEQIQSFIDDASLWVDTYLLNRSLSTATLKAIEKYLACHFLAARDPRLTQTKLGDVSETYQRSKVETEYVKMAASLDPSGTVGDQFLGTKKVSFRVGEGYDDTLDLPASG